jgi:hypothetical protein
MARLERDPGHQQRAREAERRRAAVRAADAPEWQMLRDVLEARGIGSADLGRFVSNTNYFRPSVFDERAAMPVLLDLLPRLARPNVVTAVPGHLHRPWARPGVFRAAGGVLPLGAAGSAQGSAIGDALATAPRGHLPG